VNLHFRLSMLIQGFSLCSEDKLGRTHLLKSNIISAKVLRTATSSTDKNTPLRLRLNEDLLKARLDEVCGVG